LPAYRIDHDRSRRSWDVCSALPQNAAHEATATSIAASAGNSRRARRIQKLRSETPPLAPCSSSNSDVMR